MESVKRQVVNVLNRAVAAYIRRNHIKIIAVAGSIGKTSTTNAIRTVLSQAYRVHWPKTAYNTTRSVHLELFDMNFATSLPGWFWAVAKVLVKSMGKAPYEVAVIEIGTDHPGELRTFAWLQPDIGVLTAIAPEHMESFKTIEAVAEEELAIASFCKQLVCNSNTVARAQVPADMSQRVIWYGKGTSFEARNYQIVNNTVRADFRSDGDLAKNIELQVLGAHSLDALTAALTVGKLCGMSVDSILAGLRLVKPVKGRMQRLAGSNGVTIIDDSYNASPRACKAALDVLGQFDVPQRVAVLGMMNEMGEYSATAHREVGAYCDASKLAMVLTIGDDANSYLAGEAEKRDCKVERFTSPYDAGVYLTSHLRPGAAVLFKGSQNAVFAEEAIKPLLADVADEAKLVRQSDYWMRIKRQQFDTAPVSAD